MKLLLDRDQIQASVFSLVPLRIGNGVSFTLHAQWELDSAEEALIKTYNLAKVVLIASDPIEDIKRAFRPALLLGVVTFFLGGLLFGLWSGVVGAGLVTIGMTIIYFKTLREQIVVSELMAGGRKFRCDSIVALIHKEAYVRSISGYMRQVLESAKNWADREALDIPPLSAEEAKLAVLDKLK